MRCLVAIVVVVAAFACGRIGFEPVGANSIDAPRDTTSDPDAMTDAVTVGCWLAACAGQFACCTTSSTTCVNNPQQCSGFVTQCNTEPPYEPCGAGEVCCIQPPETYPRCVPDLGVC